MAFEGLTQRLQDVFKKLRGKGKISAEDVNLAMREVRLALLEADVNFKVVKDFIGRVKERAVGQEVLQSLTPGQQIIKIVHDEMTALMGGSESKLNFAPRPPSVFIMVGLQGAGKTTTVAKLGKVLVKQGRKPLLVACDIYRPAAIKQLQVLDNEAVLGKSWISSLIYSPCQIIFLIIVLFPQHQYLLAIKVLDALTGYAKGSAFFASAGYSHDGRKGVPVEPPVLHKP